VRKASYVIALCVNVSKTIRDSPKLLLMTNKPAGELALALFSFKRRPTGPHQTVIVAIIHNCHWGRVAPNASSARVLSRMS